MIHSPLLSTVEGTIHGFGTRTDSELPTSVVTVKQVHGTYLYFVGEDRRIEKPGYDILMTGQRGTPIGVKTADCLPILLVETEKRIVAAAHAGWRGTASCIIRELLEEIQKRGGRPENLSVSIGPCIQGSCYEVGGDVVREFDGAWQDPARFLRRSSETKWHLNLQEANRLALIEGGVRPERIDTISLCTHCRPDLFHSYRRDGEQAGRMVNFIQLL